MKAYFSGTRADALANMVSCAIRDQRALIDAYTPIYGEPDKEAKAAIRDAQMWIADFERLAKELVS